jgi:hypothetical protein
MLPPAPHGQVNPPNKPVARVPAIGLMAPVAAHAESASGESRTNKSLRNVLLLTDVAFISHVQ